MILGYQIGYRTQGIGGYTEPYTDLPLIDQKAECEQLLRTLRHNFPNAEWRMVEVWE